MLPAQLIPRLPINREKERAKVPASLPPESSPWTWFAYHIGRWLFFILIVHVYTQKSIIVCQLTYSFSIPVLRWAILYFLRDTLISVRRLSEAHPFTRLQSKGLGKNAYSTASRGSISNKGATWGSYVCKSYILDAFIDISRYESLQRIPHNREQMRSFPLRGQCETLEFVLALAKPTIISSIRTETIILTFHGTFPRSETCLLHGMPLDRADNTLSQRETSTYSSLWHMKWWGMWDGRSESA